MITKIISAFPGTGKSFYSKNNSNILDSDSSQFSWSSPGVRHPDFPTNYINHIKENIGKADIIFVSSHDVVREALEYAKLKYFLVYPNSELKEEYLTRFKERGSPKSFISFINNNWDKFMHELLVENGPCVKIKLERNEYISDFISTWSLV